MSADPTPKSAAEVASTGTNAADFGVVLGVVAAEAERQMTICNACRYCSGLCAVFPAMERRRVFDAGDLDLLANLCHHCGACLYDCQYAPPHPFAVSVPATFTALRTETWERYAWPAPLARWVRSGPLATTALTSAIVTVFVAVVWASMGSAFLDAHTGEGAFYEVVPHGVIVGLFGAAFGLAVASMAVSVRRFWRAVGGGRPSWRDLAGAFGSAATLEYLDGGGVGCMHEDEHPTDTRRPFHHLTSYGFALCFAATTLAAVLETGFDRVAPYPWWHPVVILGTVGGVGLVVGPAGLWRAKRRRDPDLADAASTPMEHSFLLLLATVSVTGLAVLFFRSTAAMPALLAVHLGVVLTFFVTLPATKFVHAAYRTTALVRNELERRVA